MSLVCCQQPGCWALRLPLEQRVWAREAVALWEAQGVGADRAGATEPGEGRGSWGAGRKAL